MFYVFVIVRGPLSASEIIISQSVRMGVCFTHHQSSRRFAIGALATIVPAASPFTCGER